MCRYPNSTMCSRANSICFYHCITINSISPSHPHFPPLLSSHSPSPLFRSVAFRVTARLSVGFRSDLASVVLSIRLSVGRTFRLDSASVVPGTVGLGFAFLIVDPRPSTILLLLSQRRSRFGSKTLAHNTTRQLTHTLSCLTPSVINL